MSQAGTFTGRMDLILEAWEIVEDTMFVGIGVDQYRVVSPTQVPVHNMYLLLWAEGGLLALLGWMLLLTLAGVSVVRVYWVDRQARSEERRGGEEWVMTCRYGGAADPEKK